MTAAATAVSLVPEDENSAEAAVRAALANRYATVRPFLSLLGDSKALDTASAGKRVPAGVRGLPAPARRKVGVKPLLPREVEDKPAPPAWRKAVHANPDLPQGAVDRALHRPPGGAGAGPGRRMEAARRARPAPQRHLRPLRDPDASELDEDDDGRD